MIPSADLMRKTALQLERDAAKRGWDNSGPQVYQLISDGPVHVRAREIPFPSDIVERHGIVQVLARMGRAMRNDPFSAAYAVAKFTATPTFLGYGVVTESWYNDQIEDRDDRHLADIVGSKETRTAYVADTGGAFTLCKRDRGGEPEVVSTRDAEPMQVAGVLADAMRDMVWGTAQHLDPATVDMAAIEKMTVDEEASQ